MVLIDAKGYLQGQKGPIWTFIIYLGQYLKTVHSMKHIYKVIYDLSVYLLTFDLVLPLKVESRSQPFQKGCVSKMVHYIYVSSGFTIKKYIYVYESSCNWRIQPI